MLSTDELARLKSSAAMGGAPAGSSTGMNDEQFQNWKNGTTQALTTPQEPTLGDYGTAIAKPLEEPYNPQAYSPAVDLLKKNIASAPRDIFGAAKAGIEHANEGATELGASGGVFHDPFHAAEGSLKIASGAASLATSPLATLFKPLGLGVDAVAQIVSESPTLQKFAASPAGQGVAQGAGDVADAANVLGTVVGGAEGAPKVPEIAGAVRESAAGLPEATANALGGAKEALAQTGENIQTARDSRAVAQRVKELSKVESSNITIRKAVAKAAARGIDVKDIVANTDLLNGSVDKDGTIRTTGAGGAVERLQDFIRPQEDVIGETLKREGKVLPLATVEKELINNVNKSSVKGGAKIRALNNAAQDVEGYKLDAVDAQGRPWVEGKSQGEPQIPLNTIHEAKVDKYSNIDYTNPESKKADKTIARTLKSLVEKNTTSVDAKKLNEELARHYATLGFLEKLDGRKVKNGRLGKYFAQTTGAIIGSKFGPLGGIAGAEAATALHGLQMKSTFGKGGETPLGQSGAMQEAIAANEAHSKSLGSRKSAQSRNITKENGSTPLSLPSPRDEMRTATVGSETIPLSDRSQTTIDSQERERLGMQNAIRRAYNSTIENGGSTVNIHGDVPDKGFSFAPDKDTEVHVPKAEFNEQTLAKYAAEMYDKLHEKGAHLGTWEDNGEIYSDVSSVIPDEQEAVKAAIASKQLAIYDLAKGETKYIKDYREQPDGSYFYEGSEQGGVRSEGNSQREEGGASSGQGEPGSTPGQSRAELSGASQGKGIAGGQRTPNAEVMKGANSYNESQGMPAIDHDTRKSVDIKTAERIADAYDELPVDDSKSPEVKQAYTALRSEIRKQWDFATRKMGITFEPWKEEGQPYKDSAEMMQDVKDNKHLYFFTGGEPHAFLDKVDPRTGFTSNEMFRAVHDLFGHAAQGNTFGPTGEENAFMAHSQMFSPEAQRAMATETRGQNSWVNFGKHNYDEAGNYINRPLGERPYAVQKVALLPYELSSNVPGKLTPFDSPEVIAARKEIADIAPTHLIDTPERDALRTKIVDKIYGKGAPKKNRRLDIVSGPPGSGKSSNLAEPLAKKHGSIITDSDAIKELLPEFRGGTGTTATHVESAKLNYEVMKRAWENGDNVVYPTVGKTPEALEKTINEAYAKGYTVHIHNIKLDPNTSAARSMERFKETGRLVDPNYILNEVGLRSEQTHAIIKSHDKIYSHQQYDANVPKGRRYPLVERGTPGNAPRQNR